VLVVVAAVLGQPPGLLVGLVVAVLAQGLDRD
jgi:hypothetical protein